MIATAIARLERALLATTPHPFDVVDQADEFGVLLNEHEVAVTLSTAAAHDLAAALEQYAVS